MSRVIFRYRKRGETQPLEYPLLESYSLHDGQKLVNLAVERRHPIVVAVQLPSGDVEEITVDPAQCDVISVTLDTIPHPKT